MDEFRDKPARLTCADALEEAVKHYGGVVSNRQILEYVKRKYPSIWKDGTIRAHIMGCSVNHSSSHHYKHFRKFLFTVGRSQVRLYEEIDGKWKWTHTGMVKIESGDDVDEPVPIARARVVFVVHGRNLKARDAMFAFLRSIGLKPLEWSQAIRKTGKGSPYIGEILDTAFTMARAIVVLMTPDDEARLVEKYRLETDPEYESELTTQPRQNVLFEAGMSIGRNQDRTILVECGTLRKFSDIIGRHTVRIDNTAEKRRELASRLETAGCEVDITGVDWIKTGDFDSSCARARNEKRNIPPPRDYPLPEDKTRPEEIATILEAIRLHRQPIIRKRLKDLEKQGDY